MSQFQYIVGDLVLDGLVNGFREEVFGAPKPTRGLTPASAVEAVSKLVEVLITAGFAIRVGSQGMVDRAVKSVNSLLGVPSSKEGVNNILPRLQIGIELFIQFMQGDVLPTEKGFSVTLKGPINQWGEFWRIKSG